MAAIGQTIAVVDRSGKVVSTSKQLLNVFKEAKSAYRERKAEIVAERKGKVQEKHTRRALAAATISEDTRSASSSPHRHKTTRSISGRPHVDRHASASTVRSDASSVYPASARRFEQDLRSSTSARRSSPPSYRSAPPSPTGNQELIRRHTTQELALASPHPQRPTLERSNTTPAIDMDLAYGEYHPSSLTPVAPHATEEVELKGLVSKVKFLLDEANCLEHSVSAIIAHLQKNPDAMAAVALTLAEISNIASKMAPGALTALKGSAPAVFALLASPQFLIAAGVGVGITVVMFGGYKIIKKIKAKQDEKKEASMDEMMEIGGDVNRIENWRRGIAEVEAGSAGTSVDGEFITPTAAAMSGMVAPDRVRDIKASKSGKSRKSKTDKGSKSSKSSKASSTGTGEKDKKVKVKKPSPLRLMFK